MTLADVRDRLDQISEVWRSEVESEQKTDLADLDNLLAQLDELAPETAAETERVDELRGRIEILMDEIEITLGIEPPAIYTPEELEPEEL